MASENTDAAPRRFVVTGAAGFIGGALVRFLEDQGRDVIAVDRIPTAFAHADSISVDLRTPGFLADLTDRHTTVFHMAASADVRLSIADPRYDVENTFGALFEALEAARATGCRVIFPSTASIFEPSDLHPLTERSFPRPSSPYGAGKLAAEGYCFAYHRAYGTDVRVARLFNVYGVGMCRFVIHDIIRKIEANPDEITIIGDGNQVRDYLYIDDAVRGLAIIADFGEGGEDYNLASGVPVRILDLAKQIGRQMHSPDLIVQTTGQSFRGDTLRWYADISKITALGFCPQVSLEDGLGRTIDWMVREA